MMSACESVADEKLLLVDEEIQGIIIRYGIYCCFVRCVTLTEYGECLAPYKGASHYHAHEELLEKGLAMKELIVCLLLISLIPRMFGHVSLNY